MSSSIAGIAEEILRTANRPLHYLDLMKLIRKHRAIPGRTPGKTVCAVLATDSRFKRTAEGVYALSVWEGYPVARFAKDIAYDILNQHKRPITIKELGERIVKERQFKGSVTAIARQAIKSDPRFDFDPASGLASLSEWNRRR